MSPNSSSWLKKVTSEKDSEKTDLFFFPPSHRFPAPCGDTPPGLLDHPEEWSPATPATVATASMPQTKQSSSTVSCYRAWGRCSGCTEPMKTGCAGSPGRGWSLAKTFLGSSLHMFLWLPCSQHHQYISLTKSTGSLSCPFDNQVHNFLCVPVFQGIAVRSPEAPSPNSWVGLSSHLLYPYPPNARSENSAPSIFPEKLLLLFSSLFMSILSTACKNYIFSFYGFCCILL